MPRKILHDQWTPPPDNILDIIARLIEMGFTKICEQTTDPALRSIYELPYRCIRRDMLLKKAVSATFHYDPPHPDVRTLWQYEIPAVRMHACHKMNTSLPWLACSQSFDDPKYEVKEMAGPRWAQLYFSKDKPLHLTKEMRAFLENKYMVNVALATHWDGETHYHELSLKQQDKPKSPGAQLDHEAPRFVKYDADYIIYLPEHRHDPDWKLHLELTATLDRQHNPHVAERRASEILEYLDMPASNLMEVEERVHGG